MTLELILDLAPRPCPHCKGTGLTICSLCEGDGRHHCECGHDHDCRRCQGGEDVECDDCGGHGDHNAHEALLVHAAWQTLPADVRRAVWQANAACWAGYPCVVLTGCVALRGEFDPALVARLRDAGFVPRDLATRGESPPRPGWSWTPARAPRLSEFQRRELRKALAERTERRDAALGRVA